MVLKSRGRHPARRPTHPGAVMLELIDNLAIGKAEIARRMGVSRTALYKVLDEKSVLTADLAVRFERETGAPARVLLGMQLELSLWLAKQSHAAA